VQKDTDDLTVFFSYLGSLGVKAAGKMLMKLTPVANFTNILQATFAPFSFWQKITSSNCKHTK